MSKNTLKIVLTGAPGTGKTTLVKELEKRSFTCMHEISREVILEARKNGTEQLFLTEPLLFSEKLLKGRMQQYRESESLDAEMVFFDRGLPDIFAYMNYIGQDYPDKFVQVCKNHRYDFVFLMPPWEEIYITDNERYESFEQALAIHNHLMKAYESLEYSVVLVPAAPVEERADFVLNVIRTFY